MSKKIGRPLKGKEAKKITSIRLEPSVKAKIVLLYGSVQAWVDWELYGPASFKDKKKVHF
jgi:hypothetical protein